MSEMSEEELRATKLDNGSMSIENLLDYWRNIYEIPLFEIDAVKNYIKKLEGKNEK